MTDAGSNFHTFAPPPPLFGWVVMVIIILCGWRHSSFSSFESCRYAPMVRICHPLGDGISSVVNMLDSMVLRVAIWLVALTTCAGNAFVIVCRLLLHDESNSHSLFIKNLAGSQRKALVINSFIFSYSFNYWLIDSFIHLFFRSFIHSGGFWHVQHVRPNRGPHKKGAPTRQRLSDASTTFSDLWGGAYFRMQKAVSPRSIQITAAILRTVHMYLPNVFVH